MGGDGALTSGARMRVINLEGGSAALLAEELARVMQLMRKNPVQVIAPGGAKEEKKAAPSCHRPRSRRPRNWRPNRA
jgi:hypothetical protein